MKKALLVSIFCVSTLFAQNNGKEPIYKQEGDLVSMTTFYKNGAVKEQGFYKNKKLHGTWNKYNEEGIKITKATYHNGTKVGNWMFLNNGILSEVHYENNKIVSVHKWNDNNVAVK